MPAIKPKSRPTSHNELRSIARRAMIERGLLPDFSPAAIAEASAIAGPTPGSDPSIRDLRDLPWASIDNDDSRNLDQLSVAKSLPDGGASVLVAIADGSASVKIGSALGGHA